MPHSPSFSYPDAVDRDADEPKASEEHEQDPPHERHHSHHEHREGKLQRTHRYGWHRIITSHRPAAAADRQERLGGEHRQQD